MINQYVGVVIAIYFSGGAGSVVFLERPPKGAQRVGDAPRSTATGIQGDAENKHAR